MYCYCEEIGFGVFYFVIKFLVFFVIKVDIVIGWENWGFGDEVGNIKIDFFMVVVYEFGYIMGLFYLDV